MHSKYSQDMNANLPNEFRKFKRICRHLQQILCDTRHTLNEIAAAQIYCPENFQEQIFNVKVMKKLGSILYCEPTFVVFGPTYQLKSFFINSLLAKSVFPLHCNPCLWVHISYGITNCVFTLDNFDSTEPKNKEVIPELPIPDSFFHKHGEGASHSILEIQLNHPMLRDGVQILISPGKTGTLIPSHFHEILENELVKILPILVCVFGDEALAEGNIEELCNLKDCCPDIPVVFVCTSGNCICFSSEQNKLLHKSEEEEPSHECYLSEEQTRSSKADGLGNRWLLAVLHQLASLGYLSDPNRSPNRKAEYEEPLFRTDFIDSLHKLEYLVLFVHRCFQSYLVEAANTLSLIISQCLQQYILSAYDMAREIQITPRRIQYAQEKEAELYKNLISMVSEKQEEIQNMIGSTLLRMRYDLLEKAGEYVYSGVIYSETCQMRSLQEVRIATFEIHNLVLNELSVAVASQLMTSANCFREIYIGTLQRCLESLERNCLSQERYGLASDALKQTLSVAYNLKLNTSSSSNFLHSFWDRLRKLLHTLQLPWTAPPCIDASWRRRIASEMLDSLNAAHLAKCVCAQFRVKVKQSHEAFCLALTSLEAHYSGYLERTEEQRVAIRKCHAPKLARLALESMSVCDMVRYGLPKLGKELGRGQYGVVFMCDSWGGSGPCAVKSVVPPDDKHWNDLAMEFFCTRKIPEHKRIVQLRGSVVDTSYGEGCMPSVLLVMDRLSRDLFIAIRAGLEWLERMQIAIDVAEGLRYIHSQGLVHRDIKLKNVLLDSNNRAKITDFGFCIPEAMMSGSIVGTPVHMAPELLSGHYDSSVDVYAFGILFWYLCAGHVHLPYAFERFQNKEQLWTSVQRGIRPERLPCFDARCWQLMEQCWAAEPSKRPLLGYVLPELEVIRKCYATNFKDPLIDS